MVPALVAGAEMLTWYTLVFCGLSMSLKREPLSWAGEPALLVGSALTVLVIVMMNPRPLVLSMFVDF